jgi:hypothetical protein
LLERGDYRVADEVGVSRHLSGERVGVCDGRGGVREEILKQGVQFVCAIRRAAQSLGAGVPLSESGDLTPRAVYIPAELQVIGQDEVRQVITVALELVGHFGGVERHADVFGFDVADGDALPACVCASDGEVGRAAGDTLRLVDRDDTLLQRFQQRLEGGAMRAFGRIACLQCAL